MEIFSIFTYEFMVRAFIAGIAISTIAPLIGTFLVVKRYSLIADTLSHVALSGVALGLLLQSSPIVVTLLVTITASLTIEYLRSKDRLPGEAVLAMFLPGGLALSIVLLSLAKGFNSNLFSFLFGSISTVSQVDLYLILALAAITVAIVAVFYKKLLFVSVDEESAKVSGVNTSMVNNLLVILTAVTVSLSMRIVGILLVGALMVIPSVTAMQVARSFRQSLLLSVVFACISVVLGLFAAYFLNLPAGGIIVLVSLAMFAIVFVTLKKR